MKLDIGIDFQIKISTCAVSLSPWGPLFQRTQNPISFYRDGSMRLK